MTNLDNPLVSIIIPTHNRRELLTQAISSIIKQTYSNFEIIVINDAGYDVTDVLDSFNLGDKLTYHVHKESSGPPGARNTGLQLSSGDIIFYLDDDDLYLENHIELNVKKHLEGYDVVYSGFDHHYLRISEGSCHFISESPGDNRDFNRDDLIVENYIHFGCVSHIKFCLADYEVFNKDFYGLEDWEFLIRVTDGLEVGKVPEVTAVYRHFDGEPRVLEINKHALEVTKGIYKLHSNVSSYCNSRREKYLIKLSNFIRFFNRSNKLKNYDKEMNIIFNLLKGRDYKMAEKRLVKLSNILPEDGEVLYNLSQVYDDLGDQFNKELILDKVRNLDPYFLKEIEGR